MCGTGGFLVESTGTEQLPHCSWNCNCAAGDFANTGKEACAQALCEAAGYTTGRHVAASNDPCQASFTEDCHYSFLMLNTGCETAPGLVPGTVQFGCYNLESQHTACCDELTGITESPTQAPTQSPTWSPTTTCSSVLLTLSGTESQVTCASDGGTGMGMGMGMDTSAKSLNRCYSNAVEEAVMEVLYTTLPPKLPADVEVDDIIDDFVISPDLEVTNSYSGTAITISVSIKPESPFDVSSLNACGAGLIQPVDLVVSACGCTSTVSLNGATIEYVQFEQDDGGTSGKKGKSGKSGGKSSKCKGAYSPSKQGKSSRSSSSEGVTSVMASSSAIIVMTVAVAGIAMSGIVLVRRRISSVVEASSVHNTAFDAPAQLSETAAAV